MDNHITLLLPKFQGPSWRGGRKGTKACKIQRLGRMGAKHSFLYIIRCSEVHLRFPGDLLATRLSGHFFLLPVLTHLKSKFYLQGWNFFFYWAIMIQFFKMLNLCDRGPYIYGLTGYQLLPARSCWVWRHSIAIQVLFKEAKKVGGRSESAFNSKLLVM